MIQEAAADAIEEAGIQMVRIRSVLTCESPPWGMPDLLWPQPGHHGPGGHR
jgi:hypothetical protein